MVYDACEVKCGANQLNLAATPFAQLASLNVGKITIEYRAVSEQRLVVVVGGDFCAAGRRRDSCALGGRCDQVVCATGGVGDFCAIVLSWRCATLVKRTVTVRTAQV